jgi:NAD(P)-dependent dehydrogenase (short-subunit alcohol dehydrogenase family)
MSAFPERFNDRCAVVTGGVSGIGRAVVERMAAEGARVIVLDRNAKLWQEIQPALGPSVEFVEVDLGELDSIATSAARVTSLSDRVDVLVNAAGLVHIDGKQQNLFFESGLRGWELLVDVNLRGPAALALELREALTRRRGGAIVNVSSEGQFGARDSRWIYDVTKAGMLSLTRSLAAAFVGHGVRVNAVAPGGTLTEMHLNDVKNDPDAARHLREMKLPNLMQRFASPGEIAAVICFLASDDASFMTGATVAVDGGGRGI